jgi:hypothetical protein
LVGAAVGGGCVAVALGARVFVAGGGEVAVGIAATGRVAVGITKGGEVRVGKKTAVMVRSGVGKTIGVGVLAKEKLQARATSATNPTAKIGDRYLWIILLLYEKTEDR